MDSPVAPEIIVVADIEYKVIYVDDLWDIVDVAKSKTLRWITYDTETTGLHLKKDKPFYAAVCFDRTAYVFKPTKTNLLAIVELSKYAKKFYAHNAIFDMCMTANVIGDEAVKSVKNWADSMCNARLTFESISPREGGDSLSLKPIGKKYIDPKAGRFEDAVKDWLRKRKSANNSILTALLRSKKYTRKWFDACVADKIELPQEVVDLYEQWKKEYPEPTYQDVPLELMLPYLAVDVILCDILVGRSLPVMVMKKHIETFDMECKLLPKVFKMVRAGFTPDRPYLLESRRKLEAYIRELTIKAHELAGRKFKVGQHKLIKDMYEERTGVRPDSTDKPYLQKQAREGDELARIISKLRTCEKWLSTYINRILDESEFDGRYYPSLNPYNPVTGRFSGDCQQMPKDALLTIEGTLFTEEHPSDPIPEEYILYDPRKSILVSGGIYKKLAFIDVSQYELRWGAHYTLKFGGDLNLCRAYMPFKCKHYKTGEKYDPYKRDHILRWNEKQEDGKTSAWLLEEVQLDTVNGGEWVCPWTPTDVHSSTTIKALPAMGHDPSEISKAVFDYWRQKGKRYNFLKFYGGGPAKAAEALEISLDNAKALNVGFEEAFPMLVTYSDWVVQMMNIDGFLPNLYGRSYHIHKSFNHYKVANYLIQGGTADDFKRKMIKADDFLEENNCQSRLVHPIHDEIIMDIADGEDWVIDKIKAIIEDTPILNVPIVAEASISTTNWKEKKKVA